MLKLYLLWKLRTSSLEKAEVLVLLVTSFLSVYILKLLMEPLIVMKVAGIGQWFAL